MGEIINFDKAMVNIGSDFDGSTFTCDIRGYYEFGFTGTGLVDSDTDEWNSIQVLKNDVKVYQFWDDTARKDTYDDDNALINFQFIIKLNVGDKVKLKLENGKIDNDDRKFRVFSGKFIRPL